MNVFVLKSQLIAICFYKSLVSLLPSIPAPSQRIHRNDSRAVTAGGCFLAEEIVVLWDVRNSGNELKQMTADEDAGSEVEMPKRGAEGEWEDKRRRREEEDRRDGESGGRVRIKCFCFITYTSGMHPNKDLQFLQYQKLSDPC